MTWEGSEKSVRSIKSFILVTAVIVSLALFTGTYLVVSGLYGDSVRKDASQTAQLVARQTFNAMFEVMRLGWTREQLERFLGETRRAFGESSISLEISTLFLTDSSSSKTTFGVYRI